MAAPKSLQDTISRDLWRSHSYSPQSISPPTRSSPMAISHALLSHTNTLLPFSTATSILDIACGPGTVFSTLFTSPIPLAPTASLLATDISPGMVAQIHARQSQPSADTATTWARVHAFEADATSLPTVPDGSQSHVLSQMGIFLIPDSALALAEVRRVMRKSPPPSSSSSPSPATSPASVFGMTTVASATWNSDVVGLIEEIYPSRRLPVMPPHWRDKRLMKSYLEGQGFKEVEVHEEEMKMGFDSPEGVVGMLWRNLPYIKGMIEGLDGGEVEGLKRKMVERVRERFPGGEMPGMALVATARV
ncbi:hypothetical protein BDZ85DRAFT_318092 [Elsinoe ampelina]|uniref:Methyltransferase domain-containing protein n=1 Tax=Elsinoe ampelina TaxID=302913 RepID=A0A6A6GEN1_9PEZI|nr:hypothetical protein BDZ85DRAFT_318092 [Elsinoe ampelina]